MSNILKIANETKNLVLFLKLTSLFNSSAVIFRFSEKSFKLISILTTIFKVI